jgi:hypothetical protein
MLEIHRNRRASIAIDKGCPGNTLEQVMQLGWLVFGVFVQLFTEIICQDMRLGDIYLGETMRSPDGRHR